MFPYNQIQIIFRLVCMNLCNCQGNHQKATTYVLTHSWLYMTTPDDTWRKGTLRNTKDCVLQYVTLPILRICAAIFEFKQYSLSHVWPTFKTFLNLAIFVFLWIVAIWYKLLFKVTPERGGGGYLMLPEGIGILQREWG